LTYLIPPFTNYFMRLHFLLLLLGLVAGLPGQAALAQVVAPTEGGEVDAIRVTATTMELSFGTTGNGQGRVITMAASEWGIPVPLVAQDGRFYTSSATYGQGAALGSGYVVYNGSGHTVTVTGLKPDTYYYVVDAEYNSGGSSIAYNTRSISMATATRSAPTISAPVFTPLPVELVSFNGSVNANNIATLRWTTASERNSAFFALERSPDGTTFTEVGRVAAATSSTKSLSYKWVESNRLLNTTYYRLRQVDNDATTHYSKVISLAPVQPVARLLEVYPNPSAGQTIQVSLQGYSGESLTLRVTDALGRTILTQTVVPTGAQYLAPLALPEGLTAGTYVLTLANSSAPIQKRIIVSN
jgi:hypothetical protein